MGGAVAVILLKERQVADAFERAGATSPEHARHPEDIGVSPHGVGWHRLRERAIIREAGPTDDGRYYLDREVWLATRRMRRRLGFALLAAVIVAAIVFGAFGR
jgi:hypothetical protein